MPTKQTIIQRNIVLHTNKQTKIMEKYPLTPVKQIKNKYQTYKKPNLQTADIIRTIQTCEMIISVLFNHMCKLGKLDHEIIKKNTFSETKKYYYKQQNLFR